MVTGRPDGLSIRDSHMCTVWGVPAQLCCSPTPVEGRMRVVKRVGFVIGGKGRDAPAPTGRAARALAGTNRVAKLSSWPAQAALKRRLEEPGVDTARLKAKGVMVITPPPPRRSSRRRD